MEFVSSFIYLLELRLHEKLMFDINIDPKYMKRWIAPMTLQILIENAVKHNVASGKRPLKIVLFTDENENLVVRNRLQKKRTTRFSSGIGLENIRSRYRFIVDKDVDVHNYEEVLSAIQQNTNPEADISFNKGPLDVLDHSSTKFSFGSKMGIDATVKYTEEESQFPDFNHDLSSYDLKNCHQVNQKFASLGLLICSVKKSDFIFKNWVDQQDHVISNKIKTVVIVDDNIDTDQVFNVVWTASNHIDPQRDSIIKNNIIFIDGTKKTKAIDGFERDWPNPVVMDDETIEKIDEIWSKLGLGDLINSPSLEYKKQMTGLGAVSPNL